MKTIFRGKRWDIRSWGQQRMEKWHCGLLGEMEERGVQGQETEESALPDVVLTDVKMPVMDGLAFSKIFHDKYPDMQIVFLSGYNDFEYVKSALAVEACGYILKPLDPEELKSTMEKVREKCSKTFKDKKSQAVVTAENLKNLLCFAWEKRKNCGKISVVLQYDSSLQAGKPDFLCRNDYN